MQLKLNPATSILVLISILVTLLGLVSGMTENIVAMAAFIPGRLSADAATAAVFEGSLPFFITPFTSSFIHLGVFDLIIPALLMLLLGNMTEDLLGWKGILALYAGGVIASAVAIMLFAGGLLVPFAGAFNAVSAVIAAYLILYPIAAIKPIGNLSPEISRFVQLLAMWFLINLMMNFSFSIVQMLINVAPTMASFATGLLLARPLLRWKYKDA